DSTIKSPKDDSQDHNQPPPAPTPKTTKVTPTPTPKVVGDPPRAKQPDMIVVNGKFAYEAMFGEVTGEGKNNTEKNNLIDLVRLGLFMKDSLDLILQKTDVNHIFETWALRKQKGFEAAMLIVKDSGKTKRSRDIFDKHFQNVNRCIYYGRLKKSVNDGNIYQALAELTASDLIGSVKLPRSFETYSMFLNGLRSFEFLAEKVNRLQQRSYKIRVRFVGTCVVKKNRKYVSTSRMIILKHGVGTPAFKKIVKFK
ncbi:19589_t:CDS:2, partial [Dentiscutata erythropus]